MIKRRKITPDITNKLPIDVLWNIQEFLDVKDTVNLSILSKDFLDKIFASNSTISNKTDFWKLQLKKMEIECKKNKIPNLNLEFREKVIAEYKLLKLMQNFDAKKQGLSEFLSNNIGEFLSLGQEYFKIAEEIAKSINDDVIKGEALFKIVKYYLEIRNIAKAEEIAKSISNNFWKDKGLFKILNYYLSIGRIEKAKAIERSIDKYEYDDDDYDYYDDDNDWKAQALLKISNYYLSIGGIGEAEVIAKSINSYRWGAKALFKIACYYIEIRDAIKVNEMLCIMRDNYYVAKVLLKMVDWDLSMVVNTVEQTTKIIKQVETIAENINDDGYYASKILIKIANYYLLIEKNEGLATKIIERVVKKTNGIDSIKNCYKTLLEIVKYYLKIKKVEEAKKIAQSIRDCYWKTQALLKIEDYYREIKR